MFGSIWEIITHEAWPGLGLIWVAFYLPIAVGVCLPGWWFWRKRLEWNRWIPLLFVVPYLVWGCLSLADPSGKSWGNLYEPVAISLLSWLIPVSQRPVAKVPLRNRLLAAGVILSFVGVLLWAFVPRISVAT